MENPKQPFPLTEMEKIFVRAASKKQIADNERAELQDDANRAIIRMAENFPPQIATEQAPSFQAERA